MKTYEDLTKAEKEKLNIYTNFCINSNIQLVPLITLGIATMLVGLFVTLVFVLPIVMLAGYVLVFMGLYLILASFLIAFREKKRMFLIFGYKDSIKDLFEINNSDLRKVRIDRKAIWKKEE